MKAGDVIMVKGHGPVADVLAAQRFVLANLDT